MRGLMSRATLALASLLAVAAASVPADAGRATLNMVLVLDGLRPDAITAEETPNLWKLRREGVNFINSHSVFPTVTRVNAAAIATGTWPGRNGMVGNSIYVRAVDPRHAFSNDDHKILLRLDEVTGGGMVLTKSLGEILQESGRRLVTVSSGSTGSALLTNPRAPRGVGALIDGYWQPGVALPQSVSDEVLARFGPPPVRGGASEPQDSSVAWTQRVLRDYVLTDLKPDVVISTRPVRDRRPLARASAPTTPRSGCCCASSKAWGSRTRPTSSWYPTMASATRASGST